MKYKIIEYYNYLDMTQLYLLEIRTNIKGLQHRIFEIYLRWVKLNRELYKRLLNGKLSDMTKN